MYSDVILTDDNFDEELEKLCEFAELSLDSYDSFVHKLDGGFSLQMNNNKEGWIRHKTLSNKGSDFRQAIQKGQVAYEFANGFIILDYEEVL